MQKLEERKNSGKINKTNYKKLIRFPFICINKNKTRYSIFCKSRPYKIIEKVSPVIYKIDFPKNIRIHPIIHVSELEPYYKENFKRKKEPPPPIIVNNEEEYEIE